MPLPLRESEDERANGDGPVFKRSELAETAGRDFLIKEMDLLQSVFNKIRGMDLPVPHRPDYWRGRADVAIRDQERGRRDGDCPDLAGPGMADRRRHPLGALVRLYPASLRDPRVSQHHQ